MRSSRLVLVVWLVSVSLLAKGGAQLLWHPGTGYDVRLLWSASRYLLGGVNPFDASFYLDDMRHGVPPGTTPTYLPDIGWPEQVNYPPSSTLTQLAVYGARSPDVARLVYLVISLAACVYVAWWAWCLPARDSSARWLTAGVVLANLGFSQTLINGNYGALVIGALALALATRRRFPRWSGLSLAIALVKPTISAPFVLLFLAERRYRVLTTCLLYLALSTVVTMLLAHASLSTLFNQSLEGAARFASGGFALWKAFEAMGASHTAALAANAILVLTPLVWCYWRRRQHVLDADDWPLLAATALAARLFTYHNSIDNVVLLFVVVALVQRASRVDDPWAARLAGLVVVSLLLPLKITDTLPAHLALYACWTAAVVYLLASPRVSPRVAGPRNVTRERERVLQ